MVSEIALAAAVPTACSDIVFGDMRGRGRSFISEPAASVACTVRTLLPDADASTMVTLGLVVAQFNVSVTEPMAEHARSAADEADAEVGEIVSVPGVYDAPLAADRLARRDDIDAVAVIGAIVTGDTDHDRVIGDATAQALTRVGLDRDTPVTFGISGPGMSGDEARERVEKGAEAVNAAIQMACRPR
jgi:6,7-dimethyl-8-ribityllumazine synthase